MGTGRDGNGAVTGRWTGPVLQSRAALLHVRVLGTLRPPATTLVLRTADGREVAPLQNNFSALDRWKRINFPVPDGRFQIAAEDDDPAAWFAFTAPVEVTGGEWLLGKILRPMWINTGWGILITPGLYGVFLARHRLAASADSPASRVQPWVAVAGYALNDWWEGHGDKDPGRGPGRPHLPAHWKQVAVVWGDEIQIWQWSPETP